MLLLLLILSLSFGQLGRLQLAPGLVVYLHDFFTLPVIIFYLPQTKLFSAKLFRPILAFSFVALISLVFAFFHHPPSQVLQGGLYLVRWLAYALVYFVAFSRQASLKSQLIRFLSLAGLTIAITGLLQYFLIPDMRFLYHLGWDEHYYRLIGTFLDPNFTGLVLVLTLILLTGFKDKLTIRYLLLAISLIALLLTYSRSSYLALLATATAWLFFKRKLNFLIPLTAVFLILLLLLPRPGGEGVKLERLYSLTNRLDSMKTGLQIFKTSPLTGIGFNLLRYYQGNLISHSGAGLDNSPIFILATTGILGLAAYLWLLYRSFKFSSLISQLSLIAIITHSLFNNSLFYAPVMLWLWLLLALDG